MTATATLATGSTRQVIPWAHICRWCGKSLQRSRSDAKFCSKLCRQASWRFRVGRAPRLATTPMLFAYADPPYPGKAHYYPEKTEVDYRELVEKLEARYCDGWALSVSSAALDDLFPGSGAISVAWARYAATEESESL